MTGLGFHARPNESLTSPDVEAADGEVVVQGMAD